METFQLFYSNILTLFTLLPFSGATWLVLFIMGFFTWLFMRASHNPNSQLNWEDLIVDQSTGKASPYKLGFLIGVIVSTWATITFVDRNKLTYDLYGIYLAFLLGGAGFNSWLKGKSNTPDPTTPTLDDTTKKDDATTTK